MIKEYHVSSETLPSKDIFTVSQSVSIECNSEFTRERVKLDDSGVKTSKKLKHLKGLNNSDVELDHLTPEQQRQLSDLIREFVHRFPDGLG